MGSEARVRDYLKELGDWLWNILAFPLICLSALALPIAIIHSMWRNRSK
jgi:hypothetical protein